MGESFGPYRLERLLGRGGMGEVHRAYDTARSRAVALKRLHPHLREPSFERRFRLEARAAARLSSPHVVPIHDFGEINGQLFIDMRLVDGVDLAVELTRAGPMQPARAVEVVRQLADALDSAHAAGLVHRDVKPSNAVLAAAGGRDFAYLVDFGIVRAAGDVSPHTSRIGPLPSGPAAPLTGTGMVIGTLAYMAPELFDGGRASVASDVYALGCVLYEALTARAPFSGNTPTIMRQHFSSPAPHPSQVQPGVPRALGDVIAEALAKEPARRPSSAGALAAAAQTAATAASAPTWVRSRPGTGGGGVVGGQRAVSTWVPAGAPPAAPARTSGQPGFVPSAAPPAGAAAMPRAPERTEGVFTGPRFRAAAAVMCVVGVVAYVGWGLTNLRCTINGAWPCEPTVVMVAAGGTGVALICLGLAVYGWARGGHLHRRNLPSAFAVIALYCSPILAWMLLMLGLELYY